MHTYIHPLQRQAPAPLFARREFKTTNKMSFAAAEPTVVVNRVPNTGNDRIIWNISSKTSRPGLEQVTQVESLVNPATDEDGPGAFSVKSFRPSFDRYRYSEGVDILVLPADEAEMFQLLGKVGVIEKIRYQNLSKPVDMIQDWVNVIAAAKNGLTTDRELQAISTYHAIDAAVRLNAMREIFRELNSEDPSAVKTFFGLKAGINKIVSSMHSPGTFLDERQNIQHEIEQARSKTAGLIGKVMEDHLSSTRQEELWIVKKEFLEAVQKALLGSEPNLLNHKISLSDF